MNQDTPLCDCRECRLRPLFFNNIKDHELRNVCNSKHEISFVKGEIIFEKGYEIRKLASSLR